MVKSDYRSELCVTIIESIKNVSKLQARATFLQKCHNFKITPPTMTVKPMKNSDPKLNTKYVNVAKTAYLAPICNCPEAS